MAILPESPYVVEYHGTTKVTQVEFNDAFAANKFAETMVREGKASQAHVIKITMAQIASHYAETR